MSSPLAAILQVTFLGYPERPPRGPELCLSLVERGGVGALGCSTPSQGGTGHCAHRQPLSGLHPQSFVNPRGDDMTRTTKDSLFFCKSTVLLSAGRAEPVECSPPGCGCTAMSHGNLATSVTTQTPRPRVSLPGSPVSPDWVFRPQGFLY